MSEHHSDAELQQLFKSFDLDGSGTVSVEEIDEVAKKMGLAMPHDELLELVRVVDRDQSGELELAEFVQCAHTSTHRTKRPRLSVRVAAHQKAPSLRAG